MSEGLATLFCGGDSVARIEGVETAAIVGGVEASRRRNSGGFVVSVGGGAACFAEVGSPLNKVVGVGFVGVPSTAEWEAVEAAYTEVGVPVQVELAHLADPRIGAELTGRGYRLLSFENVLGMRLAGRSWSVPSGVEVRRDDADGFEVWLDAVVGGFAQPDEGTHAHEEFPREAIATVMRDLSSIADTHRYVAYLDGSPAGGASMRTTGGLAALTGAATLPTYRRRGVQTALLTARLTEAAAAGCDLAVITTEPGSKSQQNAQGRGFSLLYTRAILVKSWS